MSLIVEILKLYMNLTVETIKLLAVLLASGTAIYGINSWRREARWKNKYQIAEQVLSLFYEARDLIKDIRHPLRTGEGETRKRGENESEVESRYLDQAHIATERFEKNKDVFNDLRKLRYRFMALFGDEYRKSFDELDTILNEIFKASKLYWEYQLKKEKGQQSQYPTNYIHNQMEKYEKTIYSDWPNEDKHDKKVDEIVKEIETVCGKIIREQSR